MNSKIDRAHNAIEESGVPVKLKKYSPEVVSTIFVHLDTAESDIDIVCTYQEQDDFLYEFSSAYRRFTDYRLRSRRDHVVGQFRFNHFMFEVYASEKPVQLQAGYRHYQVMKRLVKVGGNGFIDKVRELKEKGVKTEPAICRVMNISGDPYSAVLELEHWSEKQLEAHLASAGSLQKR